MGEIRARRGRYLAVALAAAIGWAGMPQLAHAADAAVVAVTFNNVSASSALNTAPDSSTDVDDFTVEVGKDLYLPASADASKLSGWLKLDDGSTQPFTPSDYTATQQGAGTFDLKFGNDAGPTIRAYQSSEVPAMYIKTVKGLPYIEQDKTNVDTGGSMALVGPDAAATYNGSLGEMKGRGNTTWAYPKKPYQIKLGKNTELVPNAGSAKTWVLLANYLDASLIRNEVAYNLEGALLKRQGLNDYSIKGQMIDLWIDGGFRGSYYLAEKVQVGSTRVAITDLDKANETANPGVDLSAIQPTKASSSDSGFSRLMEAQYVKFDNTPTDFAKGGFLFEMDFASGSRGETSYFITKRGTPFTLKSPEIANADELGYAARYMQDLEDAIFSDGTAYTNHIDVQSFANYYALQELLANDDAFKSSTYFYMNNGGKLVAGPVWDCDRCLGSLTTAANPASIHVAKLSRVKPQWIKQLLTHPDFRQAVQKAYRDNVTPEVDALLAGGGLGQYASEVADSARLNKLRWPTHSSNVVWSDTPAGDITTLRSYLSQRQAGMSALFGDAFLKNTRLPDGTYTIVNGRLNLDVAGASTASQANVQLWNPNTTGAQKFSVKRGADSYYTITNVNSGKVLDVAGAVAAAGTNVWQNTANGTLAQKWAIGTYDGVNYTIASALGTKIPADTGGVENGFVLDAKGAGTTAGTNIQIYTDNGTAAQKFSFGAALVDGRKYAISSKLNKSKVVDVAGGSTANGANIRLWDSNGTNAQRYTLRNISGDVYEIRTGTTTGKVVDVAGGRKTPGTNVWQYQVNNTLAQRWSIVPTGDGDGSYYFVSKVSGLYLDVAGAKTANGTNIWTWTGNRTNAQKFYLN